jgi:hypothetical protein
MNIGLKVALKNLTEVVSTHAPNAVWATEEAKKQVFEAISLATASLTVSAIRKAKKLEKSPTGSAPASPPTATTSIPGTPPATGTAAA